MLLISGDDRHDTVNEMVYFDCACEDCYLVHLKRRFRGIHILQIK